MKVGLFGGTFNPIHNGHLGIIQHVKSEFALEKIYIIPSATPPHKPGADLAPAKDRFLMADSSIKDDPDLIASDIELKREGPSYTIDTIHTFQKEHSSETDFYLLMGSDAFLDITTWKATQALFQTIKFIIMLRGDWKSTDKITSFIDENISKEYIFNTMKNAFQHPEKKDIFICKVPRIDISSTMIRERIQNRTPISGLVPDCVEKIIIQKDIYS